MRYENKKVIERELELAIEDEMHKAELAAAEEVGFIAYAHPHPEAFYPLIRKQLIEERTRKFIGVRY